MLLETLLKARKPCGVTELAHELGLAKSNVHRLLQTLVYCGYVLQDSATGRYSCTMKLWQLSAMLSSDRDIKALARPYLQGLASRTQETVHLSMLSGAEVIYIDKIDSSHPIGTYTKVGGRAPAYAVSTGKAMLATLSDDEVRRICSSMEKFTDRTLYGLDSLLAELRRIRLQGYATNRGEWNEGVGGVAAPVFDASGRCCGAIGLSGPLDRLKPAVLKEVTPWVVRGASGLSRHLGYGEPEPIPFDSQEEAEESTPREVSEAKRKNGRVTKGGAPPRPGLR